MLRGFFTAVDHCSLCCPSGQGPRAGAGPPCTGGLAVRGAQLPGPCRHIKAIAAFFTTQPIYPYQVTAKLGLCLCLIYACIILYGFGSFNVMYQILSLRLQIHSQSFHSSLIFIFSFFPSFWVAAFAWRALSHRGNRFWWKQISDSVFFHASFGHLEFSRDHSGIQTWGETLSKHHQLHVSGIQWPFMCLSIIQLYGSCRGVTSLQIWGLAHLQNPALYFLLRRKSMITQEKCPVIPIILA